MTRLVPLIGLGLLVLGTEGIYVDRTGGSPSHPSESSLCKLGACDPDALQQRANELLASGGPAGRQAGLLLVERSLRTDPASPYRWCDLGEALAQNGDTARARTSFEQAEQLGPNNPAILIRIANFHFEHGEVEPALQRTSRILGEVSEYDDIIFGTYDRMQVPFAMALSEGIPPAVRPAQAFLTHEMAVAEAPAVEAAWAWLDQKQFLDDKLARQHTDYLLQHHELELAARDWVRFLGKGGGDYPTPNRLYNGEFEQEPAGSSFDWTLAPAEGVNIRRDSTVHHRGKYSLRIEFQGLSNLEFADVSESTVLTPGSYRFAAWLRTQNLSTDEGLRLRIFDAESSARLDVTTEQINGTTDWRRIEADFRIAGGSPRLVTVQAVRRPSLKFDNLIQGVAWLDDVSITASQGDRKQ